MTHDADDPVDGLDALRREWTPPATLEDRTVQALVSAGLLRRTTPARRRWLRVAAALLLFAAGAVAGRASVPAAAGEDDRRPRYLLLLEGQPGAGLEESRLVEEYRAWAVSLRRGGRYVTGARLDDARVDVPATAPTADDLRGYFVISAASLDEAVRIAQGSPHARRGGRLTVRPISGS